MATNGTGNVRWGDIPGIRAYLEHFNRDNLRKIERSKEEGVSAIQEMVLNGATHKQMKWVARYFTNKYEMEGEYQKIMFCYVNRHPETLIQKLQR